MSAELYDVIIIGGGPAGLATAYLCHKHNLSYLVLESGKAPFQGIANTLSPGEAGLCLQAQRCARTVSGG